MGKEEGEINRCRKLFCPNIRSKENEQHDIMRRYIVYNLNQTQQEHLAVRPETRYGFPAMPDHCFGTRFLVIAAQSSNILHELLE
jgi:hypothetical protein